MKASHLSMFRTSSRYWLFLFFILLNFSWKNAQAQSGTYMDDAFSIPINGCGYSSFTDFQNNSYGFGNNYGQPSADVWYTFTLSNTVDVSISLCGSNFDTYLHLLDGNGNLVVYNDDNGPFCSGAASSISESLTAGTYYIVVEGYSSNSGDFNLDFVVNGSGTPSVGSDLYNPVYAGSFSGAGSYTDTRNNADGCLGNNIGQASNDIYYQFTLGAESEVTLSHCGSGFDTYMHLLDASGNLITYNDDNSGLACPGRESFIQMTLPAGTYYVVSEGYSTNVGNIITNINVALSSSGSAPVIAYDNPPPFTVGTAISPVSPSNTGGAVSSAGQSTTTLAGSGFAGSTNGTGTGASFNNPLNAAVDAAGNVYVADAGNHSIRKITPSGVVTTFAGSGSAGSADGVGTSASFQHPSYIAIDASGNLFVSDQHNNRIRKISPSGMVSTFAGSGAAGSANGTGMAASFQSPIGLAFDGSGNLYVADYSNHKIRRITPSGVVSDFAGSGSLGAANGAAGIASFNRPMGLAFDAAGNLYVADRDNAMIRKITPAGVVSTLAGSLPRGYVDGPGNIAKFNPSNDLVLDGNGNIYVADQSNNMVRKVTPTGEVSVLAGTTAAGSVNGTGSVVRFNSPFGIASGSDGAIYVVESAPNLIRKIVLSKAYTISPTLPAGLVFNDTDGTISGTPTVMAPLTTYTITAYNSAGSHSTTLSFAVNAALACVEASQDQNYITTYAPREAGLTTAAAVTAAGCDPELVQTEIQYFDGLGRSLQTVQVKGSPNKKDIVVPIEYDAFEREHKKYLPYVSTGNTGAYKPDGLTKVFDYYNAPQSGHAGVFSTPFSETRFEASPLNRVLEQGSPGSAWQIEANNTGHTLKTDYGTNLANDVKLWTVTASGATAGYYAAGALYKTIIKDENWRAGDGKAGTTEEYKDFKDKVVFKRIWETDTKGLSTYYVYDDFGNLRYVLPPAINENTDRLVGAINSFSESNGEFKNFMYGYHYDSRKRLVEKKVPGKDWEFMVYNPLDQVILTQDWKQRSEGKWLLTKYDALGRVIFTGLYNDGSSRQAIQDAVNNLTVVNPDYHWWEEKSGSGVGYTNNVFPQIISYYHSLNYYDDYDFPGNVFGQPDTGLGQMQSPCTKGLLTGSNVTVLGTGSMLLTVNYYDAEGRVVQSKGQHYKNNTADVYNYDEISNIYSFTGELKESTRRHFNGGVEGVYVYNKYVYDHMGRKLSTEQKTANNLLAATDLPLVKLSGNTYNEIGQLLIKGQHSTGGGSFLQNTEYTYNERGWLKTSSSGLFSMELKYQDTGNPLYNQYNGNIAQQIYNNGLGNVFTYTYDKLNRLSRSNGGNGLGESISYDVMGNIKTLSRDDYGTNDYHISQYLGNQLKQISGFTNGAYTYNENGNLEVDGPNGNTISYNYLNLPMQVTGNENVTYLYDAGGRKLRKQSTSTGTTEYVDGIHYKSNGAIDFVQIEEGIARNNGGGYSYEYNQMDHLGNVRLSFYKNPSTELLEVLQRDDYYAFGQRKAVGITGTNKYLYNGKELQEELGQFDYGARFYDPVIGRWNVEDPLASDYESQSPYNYAQNNPIYYIDPDGRETEGFFNDYIFDTDGKLKTVVLNDDPDRFFQMDSKGNNNEIKPDQLTLGMSVQYLKFNSGLNSDKGIPLREVEINGKPIKNLSALPLASSGVPKEMGLEMSFPIESLIPQLKLIITFINVVDLMSKSNLQIKGERNQAGSAGGTNNPFKKLKPDPNKPGNVLEKKSDGRTISKREPDGFKEWWNAKHPDKKI
ncbi:DUF6443 domain-containing protein [Pedobacter hiemivivus]|uniref:T9SS type A sorting domain-containing protein n=1 Tax=Pedobacter hiemivivus TaxID=2530454 RepID=A0A4V2MKT8_9SPHI|nr:DUF6443 domain-containing protein [Pedobacter hiemivivus]TCC99446.1 hypothetical protein EZ444_01855 [Pedobacter hiemivivus]